MRSQTPHTACIWAAESTCTYALYSVGRRANGSICSARRHLQRRGLRRGDSQFAPRVLRACTSWSNGCTKQTILQRAVLMRYWPCAVGAACPATDAKNYCVANLTRTLDRNETRYAAASPRLIVCVHSQPVPWDALPRKAWAPTMCIWVAKGMCIA